MGQYHRIVNLTSRAAYSPRDLGNFLKLTEFGSDSMGTMTALLLLLHGPWAGDRIAIVGDYGDSTDLPADLATTGDTAYSDESYADAGPAARALIEAHGIATYQADQIELTRVSDETAHPEPSITFDRYTWANVSEHPSGVDVVIANTDKQEVLDPAGFGNSRDLYVAAVTGGLGGITTALTAVLAAANKGGPRGGGDFPSRSPILGSWAGNRVAVIPAEHDTTTEYVDISPSVRGLLTDTDEGGYEVHPDGVTFLGPTWARER